MDPPAIWSQQHRFRTKAGVIGGPSQLGSRWDLLLRGAAGKLGEDTEKGKAIRSKVLRLSRDSTVVYAKSGHHAQLDQPNTVIATVRQIVEPTRRGAKNPSGHANL